jgi:hypothetical protein
MNIESHIAEVREKFSDFTLNSSVSYFPDNSALETIEIWGLTNDRPQKIVLRLLERKSLPWEYLHKQPFSYQEFYEKDEPPSDSCPVNFLDKAPAVSKSWRQKITSIKR